MNHRTSPVTFESGIFPSLLGNRTARLRRSLVPVQKSLWHLRLGLARTSKRGLDVAAAGILLLCIAPVVALIMVLIKLDSRGPVFFSQTRVGEGGRTFKLWKFRSMYQDAEKRRAELESAELMSGGVRFKMRKDPRITRMGRLLRASSMDELPQLWNVFWGDMSLVGPRPPIPSEVSEYELGELRRLEGLPGITCIWQVSGRADIPFDRQVEMDIEYLDQQSLRFDLLLLLKTIPAVLFGRGAY